MRVYNEADVLRCNTRRLAGVPHMKKRVLVTGPAGRIGVSLIEYALDRYDLRLGIRSTPMPEHLAHVTTVSLDITDPDSCRQACEDIDVVVHLAAEAGTEADFRTSLLPRNLVGAYNILEAAVAAGCQRVVLSSSVQSIAGYPLDHQVQEDSIPRPLNLYGATKAFAEAIGHVYAKSHGLSCLVVRIGTFEHNQSPFPANGRNLSTFISARDMSQLLCCCVDADPDLDYAVVHGVSQNRYKRMGLTQTRSLVDYKPQDDAFACFEVGIPYRDRWFEEAYDGQRPEQPVKPKA